MKKPDLPRNETERLAALKAYQVLDTAPEAAFDDLTLLASEICGTPVALVSLVDEHRQWFKSRHGLETTETPREVAFCAHAILLAETLIVEDSLKDDRFWDNPLVTGPQGVRFYAGAQLQTPDGLNIGTLCVVDQQPRKLSDGQIRALEILARRVVSELERTKAMRTLREQELRHLHSAKFLALGEMASGMAHEINNPLTIVKGRLQRIENFFAPAGSPALEDLRKANVAADRIAKIIRGLRAFSRDSSSDPLTPANAQNIIEETLALCAEKIRKRGVELRRSGLEDCDLECRSTEISQALLNLLGNALDAVAELPERWIEVRMESSADQLRIIVTDSGSGIPPQIAVRLMQPFFTTKPVDQGTGLGLSISKGIAEAHGGTLRYDPECKHTRFILTLPIERLRREPEGTPPTPPA